MRPTFYDADAAQKPLGLCQSALHRNSIWSVTPPANIDRMNSKTQTIRTNRSLQVATRRLGDTGCIFLGLAVASGIGQALTREQFFVLGLTFSLIYWICSEATANYRAWRGSTLISETACAWITWGTTLICGIVIGAMFQYGSGLTRFSFAAWTVLTAVLLVMLRSTLRTVSAMMFSRGIGARGYAVVGVTEIGVQLAKNIADSPHLGLQLSGFYDDRPSDRTISLPETVGSRLGTVNELLEETRAGNIQHIYITFPMRAENRIRDVLTKLADTTASVYVVPDFFVFELLHSRWNNILGIPTVSIFENPFYGVDGIAKRTLDLIFSAGLIVVLAVPMAIVALAVKLSSPGPVLFKQKRYGLDGKEIPVWKFRSMKVCENGAKVTQATKNDSRVTKVGKFIRKTSLDELPQLFNVFAGDMSLVGPRPHATAHNEQYRKLIRGYMLRHKVKPGITGLAQVEGYRGETDTLEKMAKRVEFDHRYIRDWNIWLDFKILFRTIFVVFTGENAY